MGQLQGPDCPENKRIDDDQSTVRGVAVVQAGDKRVPSDIVFLSSKQDGRVRFHCPRRVKAWPLKFATMGPQPSKHLHRAQATAMWPPMVVRCGCGQIPRRLYKETSYVVSLISSLKLNNQLFIQQLPTLSNASRVIEPKARY